MLAQINDAQCYSANDCQTGEYCNEFQRCAQPDDSGVDSFVPPETEPLIGRPQGGLKHVYVAMAALDSVARINSESLQITSIAVGDTPIALTTVPDQDTAVVLNSGSASTSILRTVDDVDTVVTLNTRQDLNNLVVGPRGRIAVAFYTLRNTSGQSVGSLQDVSLIHLTPGREKVVNISVGFRPRGVAFTANGSQAFVVTEDGISELDLDWRRGDHVATTTPFSQDPMAEGSPIEVRITSNGRWAFARWPGKAVVRSVDLVRGDIVDTALNGVPTDIDISSDGSKLLVVIASTSELGLLDIPQSLGNPYTVRYLDCSPIQVGQAEMSSNNRFALVFTNTTNQEALIRADLQNWTREVVLLRKAVRLVAIAPDNRSAIVVHNKVLGQALPTDSLETVIDKRYGFSMLDTTSLFAKLQLSDDNPTALAFLPDGSAAYVMLGSTASASRQVEAVDLTSFIVTTLQFGSRPTDVGVVTGTARAFVLQDHPMGRISFIQAGSDEVRTVTGFELNSQISE